MMEEMAFPETACTLAKMMYATEASSLSLNHTLQTPWAVNKGVRQGAASSPLLFNLFPEMLIRQMQGLNEGIQIGTLMIKLLFYADDLILMAPSQQGLLPLIALTE
jgi:hypothetical protein